jgi:hypothetical protein
MTFRKRGFRAMVLGLLVVAGLALAPAAFARDHFSVGISLPGVAVGIGPHRGYVGVGGYYAPGYYGPAYYGPSPVYYDTYPGYYGPAYGVGVGYYGGYRGGYYGRGAYYGGHGYNGGGRGGYRGGNRGGGYYHH